MFYRFTPAGARISVDLDGLYAGQSVFLLGGSPFLADAAPRLAGLPVATLALNNTPCVFPGPTFWIAMDKPACFSPHIYGDPRTLKFQPINRRDEAVGRTGRRVREFTGVLFFGTRETFTATNFLTPHRDLAWWKSTFPAALQLAWRLGFTTVYLVGCGFKMDPKQQYAWKTGLSESERSWSQRTYNNDLERLRALAPVFRSSGFRVASCTPGSAAHGIIDYVDLDSAIREAVQTVPDRADTMGLTHSSALAGKEKT